MNPDRFRLFTKRGAALGLLVVVAATLAVLVAGTALAALLVLAF